MTKEIYSEIKNIMDENNSENQKIEIKEKILEKLNQLKRYNRKQMIIVTISIAIILIILFLIAYKYFYSDNTEIIIDTNQTETENIENNENEQAITSKLGIKENKKTIIVHVVGEVNTPGIVELNEGARIIDAINGAGGKTEEADMSKINLAYVIEDGSQIYVPSIYEKNNDIEYIRESAGEGVINNASTQERSKAK